MKIEREILRIGNSYGIILGKEVMKQTKYKSGDVVIINIPTKK